MTKSRRNNIIYWVVNGGILLGGLTLAMKGWRPAGSVMLAVLWVWMGLCYLLNIHPLIEKRTYSRRYCRSTGLLNFTAAAGIAGFGLCFDAEYSGAVVALALAVVVLSVIGMYVVERREKRDWQEK